MTFRMESLCAIVDKGGRKGLYIFGLWTGKCGARVLETGDIRYGIL